MRPQEPPSARVRKPLLLAGGLLLILALAWLVVHEEFSDGGASQVRDADQALHEDLRERTGNWAEDCQLVAIEAIPQEGMIPIGTFAEWALFGDRGVACDTPSPDQASCEMSPGAAAALSRGEATVAIVNRSDMLVALVIGEGRADCLPL